MPKLHQWLLIMLVVVGISFPAIDGVSADENDVIGVWQSQGFGLWFEITEDSVEIVEVTNGSCVQFAIIPEITHHEHGVTLHDLTFAGLGQYIGSADFELTLSDGLLNFDVGKVQPIQATKAETLPAVCETLTEDTPENNFETFWHMFNEHYAFFELRGVDWQATYDEYRPMVTPDTTQEELFTILSQMVAPLQDGHVSISTLSGSFSAVDLPDWIEIEDEELLASYAMLTAENYLIEAPIFTANDLIYYGKLSDTVGYINILSFSGFSDSASLNATDLELAVLAESMPEILNSLGDVESIVVDVRFNLGGSDISGLFVAGHFTDAQHLAFTKNVWFDGQFHEDMAYYVDPVSDTPFVGDVYLLTSGLTISAAETFTMAMDTLPNVTIVGEPTNGILSDQWYALLPNGWLVTLSNERYVSPDGSIYESLGVPPDVAVTMTSEQFTTGIDPSIDAVFELTQ